MDIQIEFFEKLIPNVFCYKLNDGEIGRIVLKDSTPEKPRYLYPEEFYIIAKGSTETEALEETAKQFKGVVEKVRKKAEESEYSDYSTIVTFRAGKVIWVDPKEFNRSLYPEISDEEVEALRNEPGPFFRAFSLLSVSVIPGKI